MNRAVEAICNWLFAWSPVDFPTNMITIFPDTVPMATVSSPLGWLLGKKPVSIYYHNNITL